MPSRRSSFGVLLATLPLITCGGTPTRPSPASGGTGTIASNTTVNAAPIVTAGFDGPASCTPASGGTCLLTVVASATDADGDLLTFAWSGCASGTAARGTCAVTQVGDVVATVQVSDGKGHLVSASVTAHGMAPTVTNAAPIATVRFDGARSCTPMPNKPCVLDVTVTASDPDDDPLQFAWSGCATGSSARAVCSIATPGDVAATVVVSDGHGHEVVAWATAAGDDKAPRAQIGYVSTWPSGAIELLGNVIDPEEGVLCGGDKTYCVSATGAGACSGRAGCASNFCLSGLTLFATKSADHGTCSLSIEVQDSFGTRGTTQYTFDLDDPRILHYP